MKRLLVILAMLASAEAGAFSYATGGCATSTCAEGEQWLYTNANEIDTALDALEAGTSISSDLTRDTEWDTAAEVETVWGSVNVILATEIDTLAELNDILGDGNFQTEDADLTDLADGSLSGSKVGIGLDAAIITTGTIGSTARLPAAVIEVTEIDTTTELNALFSDDVFIRSADTVDLDIVGSAAFTGTLQGLVSVQTISTTTSSPDFLLTRGNLHICTNAGGCDITLPGASAGRNACWYDANGGGVITLDPATLDAIILDGVTQTLGNAIDSAGDRGDFVCILAIDSTYWITLGRSGTFIPGGAD